MTFVHLSFSVRSLDLSYRFTRAHEGFMMCNKEVVSRIPEGGGGGGTRNIPVWGGAARPLVP